MLLLLKLLVVDEPKQRGGVFRRGVVLDEVGEVEGTGKGQVDGLWVRIQIREAGGAGDARELRVVGSGTEEAGYVVGRERDEHVDKGALERRILLQRVHAHTPVQLTRCRFALLLVVWDHHT